MLGEESGFGSGAEARVGVGEGVVTAMLGNEEKQRRWW